MIVQMAECFGCESHELATDGEHPSSWLEVSGGIDSDGITHLGQRWFCSIACLAESAGGNLPADHHLPLRISQADVAILNLLAQGYWNSEISMRLNVATSTMKNRLSRLYEKLNAPTRVEAILRAHSLGIINLNLAAAQCSARLTRRAPPSKVA